MAKQQIIVIGEPSVGMTTAIAMALKANVETIVVTDKEAKKHTVFILITPLLSSSASSL